MGRGLTTEDKNSLAPGFSKAGIGLNQIKVPSIADRCLQILGFSNVGSFVMNMGRYTPTAPPPYPNSLGEGVWARPRGGGGLGGHVNSMECILTETDMGSISFFIF